MPNFTTIFNLEKPLQTEFYNVDVPNANMDKLDTALNKLANNIKTVFNVTIPSSGWVDQTTTVGYFTYNINNSNISQNSVVDVNIQLASLNNADNLVSTNRSYDGYVTIYAEERPTSNIICDLKIVKELVV